MSPPPVPRLLALLVLLGPLAGAAQPAAADSTVADTVATVAGEPSALGRVRAALADSAFVDVGPSGTMPAALSGVVWQATADTDRAIDDLVAMRRAGVRIVRTGLVADTLVLRAASLLGMSLFQDLPVVGLPATFLVRQTDAAADLLAQALALGRPYSAARHFGLARASDTSDPRSRPYFEALTALARERGAPGTKTYYVSRFPEDDRADRTVDFVLLDARDGDAVGVLRRWRARHETPVGLASIGVGVRPGRAGGWRRPGTEAAQARTLETALADLLAVEPPPVAVFVHRWRDAPDDAERDQRAEVAGTRFGLFTADGEPRPAFDVASGFWTGRQRVFAFDAGVPADRQLRASPLLLLGWGLVLGLGVFYAGAPRLSGLAPRYFGRRDLYREAVARGYDLSASETSGLAVGLSLAAGITWAAVLRALGRTDALVAATASWSEPAQARLASLLGQPLTLSLVLALAYGTWLVLILIWLNVISGRRRLRPAQALSIAVWCRWGWFPLMIVALVLGGIDARLATTLAPAILAVGLLIEAVAGYRMMWDLEAVTHVPPARALLLGFGLPFVLVVAGLVWLALTSRAEAGFLWHLATRS